MDSKETVTIFSMSKYISQHLLEKLPKEQYVHKEDIGGKNELVDEKAFELEDEDDEF